MFLFCAGKSLTLRTVSLEFQIFWRQFRDTARGYQRGSKFCDCTLWSYCLARKYYIKCYVKCNYSERIFHFFVAVLLYYTNLYWTIVYLFIVHIIGLQVFARDTVNYYLPNLPPFFVWICIAIFFQDFKQLMENIISHATHNQLLATNKNSKLRDATFFSFLLVQNMVPLYASIHIIVGATQN